MTKPPIERGVARLVRRFDAQHWRDRAREARANAEKIDDLGAKRLMFEIARTFDHLTIKAAESRKPR